MANERLKELEIEINSKIAEAASIAEAISGDLTLKIGSREVTYDGYRWDYNDLSYDWYSSSIGC